MRFVPDGVHREALGEDRPPEWYRIWLGAPRAEGSVCIGRTRRLRRHLWHRCFPQTGEWPEDIKGWVAGVEWLIQVHNGHLDAS
jgi:hypothetical protein